jgi:hypothetical protein
MTTTHEHPSLSRLFMYIFLFILFTLHGPYCYLFMRENLVLLADGSIDYDMGGLFPFTAVMVQALVFQAFAAFIVFVLACVARQRSSATPGSVMTVAFLSMLGLQVIVYYNIYFDPITDPKIIQARSVYSTSWLFLALFSLYSIIRIIVLYLEAGDAEAERIAILKTYEDNGEHHEDAAEHHEEQQ